MSVDQGVRGDEHQYTELCSRPFASSSAADEALKKFWDAVYELRSHFGIRDVSVIASGHVSNSGPFMWSAHAGSATEAEVMAAWHFGKTQAERQQVVREAIEAALENAIKKPERRR